MVNSSKSTKEKSVLTFSSPEKTAPKRNIDLIENEGKENASSVDTSPLKSIKKARMFSCSAHEVPAKTRRNIASSETDDTENGSSPRIYTKKLSSQKSTNLNDSTAKEKSPINSASMDDSCIILD